MHTYLRHQFFLSISRTYALLVGMYLYTQTLHSFSCESVKSRPMYVFFLQFLFERVEGVSRATIIDLDAHQVSSSNFLRSYKGIDTIDKTSCLALQSIELSITHSLSPILHLHQFIPWNTVIFFSLSYQVLVYYYSSCRIITVNVILFLSIL